MAAPEANVIPTKVSVHVSRESVSYSEIPIRPLCDIAREAVLDIDHSLEALRTFGVRVPADSRLHQARDVLAEAIGTGSLIPSHRGDELGLRALEIAFDFAAIADALPPSDGPVAAMRRELTTSLTGPIDPPDEAKGPLQLQSQLIVRSALQLGGGAPYHPTHSPGAGRKSPDVLLANGSTEYAIEVKRPRQSRSILSRLDDARDQLDGFGVSGGIVLDITDCVRDTSSTALESHVRELALSLYDRIFVTGQGYRPGYERIMMAGVLVRRAWTTDESERSAMVEVHTISTIGIFASARGTLADRRARWLRSTLEDGLEKLYQTLGERSDGR